MEYTTTNTFAGVSVDIEFIAQAVHPISNSSQGNATITVDSESVTHSKQLVQGSDMNQLVGYNESLCAGD